MLKCVATTDWTNHTESLRRYSGPIARVILMGLAPAVSFVVLCTCEALAAPQGLVAHYPFDEGSGTTVRDVSGNGNHGVLHGARYVAVEKGYALEFDGDADRVEIPASESLKLPDAVAVEVWINTKFSTTGGVISKNGCMLLRQNYALQLQDGGILFQLVECPESERVAVGAPVSPNTWHHIVGMCDGAEVKIYIDGRLTRVTKFPDFSIGTYDGPLFIGASYYGGKLGNYFTGQIDDVRIYDRLLTPEAILSHYKAGKKIRISQLSAMLKSVSPFKSVDTTPPTASLASPAPDSTIGSDLIVSAKFSDAGSGLDTSSANVLLDGANVTPDAVVTSQGFTFRSAKPLTKGIHRVEVTVSDRAGNRSNRLRWIFGVDTPVVVAATFDKEIFRVSGEPYFPVGIYCGSVSASREKLGYLAQAAEAGINYKLEGQGIGSDHLDVFLKYGMKVLRHIGFASQALAKGDHAQLENVVLDTKDHPAMLGWWDESEEALKDMCSRTYEFIKQRDRRHPVVFMHTWSGQTSDAYYVYAYPILNVLLPDNSITSLVRTIEEAFEAAAAEGRGKHVWFISQAFDYRIDNGKGKVVTLDGGFRPSREEIRAMNYLALTKGVKGLLYYSPGIEIPDTEYCDDVATHPRQWTEVLKVAREVRHLAPVLTAGQSANTVHLEQENPAIHYRELVRDGVHTLIAVNVEPDLTLAKWVFDRPVQPMVLFEDRVVSKRAKKMSDKFAALEVHVYRWK